MRARRRAVVLQFTRFHQIIQPSANMHIYTKTGDHGETGLIGGLRVPKTDDRIIALGEIDELCAVLGVLRAQKSAKWAKLTILRIQKELFAVCADMADNTKKPQLINETHIQDLEKAIDDLEKSLPPQKGFVIPGDSQFSAFAHLARTVCRRAERAVSKLYIKKQINQNIQIYINRLSDLLFMLART